MEINQATITIPVRLVGAEQATAGLVDLGTKGEAAIKRVDAAMAQSQASAQRFTQQAQQAKLAYDSLNVSSADFARAGATASQIAQLTGVSMDRAKQAVKQYADAVASGEYETRGLRAAQEQMAIAGMRAGDAFAVTEKATAGVAIASARAGPGINAVQSAIKTMALSAVQSAPGVGQLANVLGTMALGSAPMIAVLGGIAAIGFAWEKLRSDADKLAKSVDEAMKKVRQTTHDAQLAMGELQLAAAQKEVDKAQRAYAAAQIPQTRYSATLGGTAINQVDDIAVAQRKKALDEAQRTLEYWQQRKTEIDRGMQLESERTNAAMLANLITTNHATAAEHQRAADLYRKYVIEIDALGKTQTDNIRREALIANAKTLSDALIGEASASAAAAKIESDQLIAATQRHIAATQSLLTLSRARADGIALAVHETEVLGLSGYAVDRLNIMYEAATATRKAWIELDGQERQRALENIIAHRDQSLGVLKVKTAYEDAAAATKTFADMQAQLAGIASKHKALTDAQTNATVKKIISDTTADIQTQARVIDQAVQGALQLANAFGLVSRNVSDVVRGLSQALTGIKPLRNAIDNLSISKEAGGTSGFDVALAALPVVGGFASAASALFSAAEAQKKAAEEARKFYEDFRRSLSDWGATFGTSVEQALYQLAQRTAGATTTSNKIYAGTGTLGMIMGLPGMPATVKHEDDAATIAALAAKERAKITADFLNSITDALNATHGPAGAYLNAVNAINKQYDDNTKSAEVLGLGEETLSKIREIHRASLEALRIAEQNRQRQINLELDAREASALGNTKEAEAIRRRAQEEAEIAAALAAHWTAEQIARLAYIQGLEDVAAAEAKAADAAKRNADAQASAQERYYSAIGDTGMAFVTRQTQEWNQALIDFAKGLINLETLNWTSAALAAEKLARDNQAAATAAQKVLDAQRQALQVQAQAAQEAIRTQEQLLNTYRQTVDTIRKYIDSSKLGNLSPLGPEARYEEARRQYLSLANAATGGDVTAAGQLPNAVEAFRQESRIMFASTQRYADDFNQTQIYLESVANKFGAQATVQEQILAQLKAQYDYLQQRLAASALPVDIGNNIPKPPSVPEIIAGIGPDLRNPALPERPGIYPPGTIGPPRRIPLHTLDDLFAQNEKTNDHLYNIRQQNTSGYDYLARTHTVISTELPKQSGYQLQTRDNTKATSDGVVRLRPIDVG